MGLIAVDPSSLVRRGILILVDVFRRGGALDGLHPHAVRIVPVFHPNGGGPLLYLCVLGLLHELIQGVEVVVRTLVQLHPVREIAVAIAAVAPCAVARELVVLAVHVAHAPACQPIPHRVVRIGETRRQIIARGVEEPVQPIVGVTLDLTVEHVREPDQVPDIAAVVVRREPRRGLPLHNDGVDSIPVGACVAGVRFPQLLGIDGIIQVVRDARQRF